MTEEPRSSLRGDSAPPASGTGEGRRAKSRWTEKLMRRGFTPVAVVFLQRYARLVPKLSHAETLLIIHLMSFKWDEKAPYPSVGLLAERLGVSTRYVRKMLKRLGALHYV